MYPIVTDARWEGGYGETLDFAIVAAPSSSCRDGRGIIDVDRRTR